ncbi:MAG: anthranilate synthase component I family protein [Phycisphaeraceae bacterium]
MVRQLNPQSDDAALTAFLQLSASQPAAFLHSGRHHSRWAKRSILAQPRAWFRHWASGKSELLDAATLLPLPESKQLSHRLWRDLRWLLNEPSLAGKWIGTIGYEVNRFIEPERLPPHRGRADDRGSPVVELALCPAPTVYPAATSPAGAGGTGGAVSALPVAIAEKIGRSRADYEAAVAQVLEYIGAGDVFQVNLAQRFTLPFVGNPRELYRRLAAISPAWYGAYLDLPPLQSNQPGRSLLCTSPELFLDVSDGHVITRPIKGTRPASASADELRASEKDAAELNMIVDLMRNDLGRVCDYGSVKVTEPRTIESHPTVHHGVATIEGQMHPSRDIVDLLRATLPGGSVTGAPKVRAMQIIDELEPVARGPYCGVIGMLSRDEAVLNIAIRTCAISPVAADTHLADFWAGGGIVADSSPAAEYLETLDKAAAVWHALAGP